MTTPVTFTRVEQAYDPTTGTMIAAPVTITGAAMQKRARSLLDLQKYRDLGLVAGAAPLLIFTPTTYGEAPAPGDKVTWAGAVYTVRDVDVLAPDGVTILAYVVIEK